MSNENLIEIATFIYPNDTDVLESMLQAEGIEYAILGKENSLIVPSEDNIRLLVKEKDVETSVRIIKTAGFEKFLNSDYA